MKRDFDALVNKFAQRDFFRYVMELVEYGQEALPAIQAGMGHSDWRIRRGCAFVTFHVAFDAEALQRLALLTYDPKKKVRKIAVLVLDCGQHQGRRVKGTIVFKDGQASRSPNCGDA